jgi:hypothetical protein
VFSPRHVKASEIEVCVCLSDDYCKKTAPSSVGLGVGWVCIYFLQFMVINTDMWVYRSRHYGCDPCAHAISCCENVASSFAVWRDAWPY